MVLPTGLWIEWWVLFALSGQTETQQRYAKQESGKIFHNKRKDERLNILTMTKTSIQKPTTR